mgnify:CR=1 FL=1|tara:strand:+ start:719 stop:889 length:171 start_codon:yes stop_codon:yes gene_type:complete
MSVTTEQELVNIAFPDDNTKTINDVIQVLVDGLLGTTSEVKEILKSSNPQITNWSF